MENSLPFENKVALVTGGSRGIGRAISLKLASWGADLIINYQQSDADAKGVAEAALAMGRKAIAVKASVREVKALERLFEEVRSQFGVIDIYVSNAATGALQPAVELSKEAWKLTLETNARAFFLGSKLALPLMTRGGSIVSISSLGSHRYIPGYAAVGASKAALESLTRTFAVEYASHGIRVNCVSGGLVDTDAIRHFPQYEEMMNVTKARTPLGRIGHPEDIADVVALLCTEEARWITGQVVVADGGFSLL
jgi:enoyl-[acyl-carrier protein] reductase III